MSVKSDAVLIVPEAGTGGSSHVIRPSVILEAYKDDGKEVMEAVRNTYDAMDDGLGDDSGLETTPQSSSSSSHNNSTRVLSDDIESQPIDEKDWDTFRKTTDDTQLYSNQGCIDACKKGMKVFMIVTLFTISLTAMVVNKGTLLFITSQVNKHVMFGKQCTEEQIDEVSCDCGLPHCADSSQCGLKSNIRWIWALYLCIVTPYFFGFVRCLWKISFKTKKNPEWRPFLAVLTIESLNTVGMCVLLFSAMPNLDVSRALFLTTAVGLVPSVLRLFRQSNNNIYLALDVLAMLCQLSALITWPIEVGVNPSPDPREYNDTPVIGDMCPAPDTSMDHGSPLKHMLYATTTNWGMTNESEGNTTSNLSMSTSSSGRVTTYPPVVSTDIPWQSEFITPLPQTIDDMWAIPVGLLLISLVWWGNFVDKGSRLRTWFPALEGLWDGMCSCKTKTYAIVSLWKIALAFFLVLAIFHNDFDELFRSNNFHMRTIGSCAEDTSWPFLSDWLEVYAIQAVPPLVCFYCADLAIKSNIQVPSFSVPLALATPVTYALLLFACFECNMWNIGTNLYWNCFHGYDGIDEYEDLFVDRMIYMGFFWWISQMWVARHIWTPKIERLAKSDRIFVLPLYCGPLLDQGLAFNRRVKDHSKSKKKKKKDSEGETVLPDNESLDPIFQRNEDDVPMIYMCATMWHEEVREMIQILKSVFRMDFDQKARKIVKEHLGIYDPDYYDIETHVFFDDAFEKHDPSEEHNFAVNKFVKQLIKVLDEAASSAHKVPMRMPPPLRYSTPYGGRLEWSLPGDTKFIVHLKDKVKIRHRKRWSQVMYMYYLLGYRLMAQDVEKGRKEEVSKNTFILALDGDVDFKPEAVGLLMDLMKRNEKVAAACGRIHPIGSGLMLWYQKFEYALGHWLQKATEHVLGCVLCSPGCFSLFRASALMDENVMKTYSTKAKEAKDYVQYDQGEDRWLCTLLLQQGYRVEYAAAADALTYAPDNFEEFFGQRKRWTPSTFANILDLLASGKETVKKNENISMLYMFYQGGLFASSILGPATIFLLIVGAFNMAFGLRVIGGFLLVFIPLLCFLILCLKAQQSTQLYVAMILSAVFAVVQMVVMAGVIIEISEYGMCSLSTIFMVFIVGEFLLAAILHPQEFFNIIYGPIYYLCIPTMYLLLIIYSLCNMNDVNWGTREVVQTEVEKEKDEKRELEAQAKQMEQKKDEPNSWMSMLGLGTGGNSKKQYGSHTCGCGTWFQCMCCLRPGESPEGEQLSQLQKQLLQTKNYMFRLLHPNEPEPADEVNVDDRTPLLQESPEIVIEGPEIVIEGPEIVIEGPVEEDASSHGDELECASKADQAITKPTRWIDDPDLGNCEPLKLGPDENKFWTDMIAGYLEPLEMSDAAKKDMTKGLVDLRNKAVFGFFIIDALLIALIIVLQVAVENGSDHRLSWNCTGSTPDGGVKEYYIDPIAITFLLIFGSFMVIQLFGMIFHRVFNFMQIVASTDLRETKYKNISQAKKEVDAKQAKALVTNMMRLDGADPDSDSQIATSTDSVRSSNRHNADDDDDDDPSDNARSQPSVVDKLVQPKPKKKKVPTATLR